MPTFIITGPDGKKYRATGPEGSTGEQAVAELQKQLGGGAPARDPNMIGAPDPVQPEPSALDQVLRQTQLFGRDVVDTGQGLAEMAVNAAPLPALINGQLQDVAQFSQARDQGSGIIDALVQAGMTRNAPIAAPNIATAAGVPTPDDGLESAIHSGIKGLLGAAATGGAGSVPALIGGVTGGVSGDVTRQAGGGPVAQLIASLAGGLAPSGLQAVAGATKNAIVNPGAAAARTAEFNQAGVQPNALQVLPPESLVTRGMDWLARKTPGSAGRMADNTAQQAQQIGSKVDDLAAQLTPERTPEVAGRTLVSGMEKSAAVVKKQGEQLYNRADKYFPPETPVKVERTVQELAKEADTFLPDSTMGRLLKQFEEKAPAGTSTYEAVAKLRTKIGKMLTDHNLISDHPQLEKLYGALSDDIGAMAASNPAGKVALDRARAFWRDKVATPIKETQHVIDRAGGGEKVFNAAMSGTKDGATTLRTLLGFVGKEAPEAPRALAGTVLSRMGKAAPNAADDAATGFTVERFVKSFDTMSPEARAVLFKPLGEKFGKDLAAVVKVAREVAAGAAKSKSAQGGGLGRDVRNATLGGATFAVLGGPGAVAGAGAVAAGANGMARLITRPGFVSWLATNAKRPSSALPALAGALAARNPDDEDIQAFADAVGRPVPNRRGVSGQAGAVGKSGAPKWEPRLYQFDNDPTP